MDNFFSTLKALATDNGRMPYVFGSMAQANQMLDKMVRASSSYPICVHLQSVDGTMLSYPMAHREESVIIGYADRIAFDFDPEAVEAQAADLKREGLALLSRINEGGYFEPVTEATYTVAFDSMDANLVIVLMSFRLREAAGECL